MTESPAVAAVLEGLRAARIAADRQADGRAPKVTS